ncbi:AAA family ATPase [Allokutzneria albata]|uniref:Shikimate kinase n=1 Tax=Allokutzneria albata TaxID=211114 RepID=A0A1G9TWY7_ALLAB|nr:shikimate kinase [Allokutzneria albata]SDM52091.1 hypothetical protein SAMN04489726_2032 [Allokutzneria albata]
MDLVFLHGPAASGKLTVARALAERVGYPVFHNHLVVDLLTTVFPFGTEPFVRLRERMWLDVITDAARTGTSLIFTFAPEPTVPAGFPGRVRSAVESAGGRVRFVRLLVGRAEQERRIGAPSRAEFHKLADVEVLRRIRQSHDASEQPPSDVDIDTETCDAETSAEIIAERFALPWQEPLPRYI